ncbi:MAG: phosphate acyltransferase [Acidobacteriota bacterium]
MIKDFKALKAEAKKKKGLVVGVPAPEDNNSILTILKAHKESIADFILTGDKKKIEDLIISNGGDPKNFDIINCISVEESAEKIVSLANEKKVHVILKGFLPTAKLMKPVLDKKTGLRTDNLLSDILLLENPVYPEKGFVGLTDGGLVILPDIKQKKGIIENGVKVFHKLNYSNPKVGIMAAIESVKESMPSTVDADILTTMNKNGEIGGCEIYGPLAFDIAVSEDAAHHKGIINNVAGNVQIMVMPNIEAGNLLGKCFTYYMKKQVAHVVMGAKIPILIPSRNEGEIDKINSIALGITIA